MLQETDMLFDQSDVWKQWLEFSDLKAVGNCQEIRNEKTQEGDAIFVYKLCIEKKKENSKRPPEQDAAKQTFEKRSIFRSQYVDTE